METFLRDLRYGVRMLVRTPAVSAIAVLALALGIGANTAIFSVVRAVLLRPLPVEDAGRLAAIQSFNPRMNIPPITPSYSVYGAWKRQAACFDGMAASWAGTAELELDRSTEKVPFWRVTAGFFPLLGVSPVIGRGFTAEEDQPGAPRVAILSYALWRRHFAADPSVAGRTIRLAGEVYSIVGVAPGGFHIDGKPADVYVPIAQDPADRKKYLAVAVYARLKPGGSLAQAQSEMDAVARRMDERGFGWKAQVWTLRDVMAYEVRLSLLVLLGAVALVLLIACANIASLLLARSTMRQREIAIRSAMGAHRGRLVAQLLTESLVLGSSGGAAGLAMATWCMRLVPWLEDARLPNLLLDTRIDGPVLAFTAVASLAAIVIFSMAPALSAVVGDVGEVLKEGGRTGESRRRKRLWSALVVSETALAMMLTVGATLLIRSFLYLRDTAPGFRVDGLVTAPVRPPARAGAMAYYRKVLDGVRAIPGVGAATLASTVPLDGDYVAMSMPLEGHQYARPQDWPVLWWRSVDEHYFGTLQVPLRRGRIFTEEDRKGSPLVAIVNEAMARRYWPGQDAVGQHMGSGNARYEIVGVVADVRHQDATKDGLVEVLFPYQQSEPAAMTLVVRATRGNPMRLAYAIGRIVAEAEGKATPAPVRELRQVASNRLAPKRLTMVLLAVFAGLALLLAATGIYGVFSFAVSQRTHEIGVRMALGAPRERVVRMIVGRAFALSAGGIAIGIGGALAVSRVLATLLYGVRPTDPGVFAGVAAVLLGVSTMAAYVPARRAAVVDPVTALRHE